MGDQIKICVMQLADQLHNMCHQSLDDILQQLLKQYFATKLALSSLTSHISTLPATMHCM